MVRILCTRFFAEKAVEASSSLVKAKCKAFLREVCSAKLSFHFTMKFFPSSPPLFSEVIEKYVYLAKVQNKIATHAQCGCVNLIDKVLEVTTLLLHFQNNNSTLLLLHMRWLFAESVDLRNRSCSI